MEAAADFEPEPEPWEPEPEPWEPEPEPWEPEPEPWEPEPEPEPEQVEMTPQQLAHSFASSAFDGLAQQVGLTAPSRPAGELEPEPDTSEEHFQWARRVHEVLFLKGGVLSWPASPRRASVCSASADGTSACAYGRVDYN